VGQAMKEVEWTLAEVDENLKSRIKALLTPIYRPESDKTQESDDTVMKGLPQSYVGTESADAWACWWMWLGCRDTWQSCAKGHLQDVCHI
jgi:hypothetical protein